MGLESKLQAALEAWVLSPLQQPVATLCDRWRVLATAPLQVEISFGFPFSPWQAAWQQQLSVHLTEQLGEPVTVVLQQKIRAHVVQPSLKPQAKIKNLIAVSSGKGGVGKSTTALNLALALKASGATVGLLDADIYGPNQASLLQVAGKQPVVRDGGLHPLMRYDLPTMSMAYLVEAGTPMVWRGPMVTKALRQLLFDTQWPELDYLVVDMPPGTGDIQLTLAKSIPVAGAVIVATGETMAVEDAEKGIEMFRKVDVPMLGLIDNMTAHTCSQCGHESALFMGPGVAALAERVSLPLLASIPYAAPLQAHDELPLFLRDPSAAVCGAYQRAALALAAQLARQSVDYSVKFPPIHVESKSEKS